MALAIVAMPVMIVCVDQLLWRPLVVWVEKFRLDETTGGESTASSWVLDFLRRARLPRRMAVFRRRAYRTARWATRPLERPLRAATPVILRGPRVAFEHPVARKLGRALLVAAVAAGAAAGLWQIGRLLGQLGLAEWRQLVTGWVTAAGGAWNGSIVAEYIEAGGRLRETRGLGSLISEATAHANFPLLAGGIALMSLIVVGWNRVVWRSLMVWAQTRFGYGT